MARVLRAGSSKGSGWKRHCMVWAPSRIRKLAISMGGTYITWYDFLGELADANVVSMDEKSALGRMKRRDKAHGNSTANFQWSSGVNTGSINTYIDGELIGSETANIEQRPFSFGLSQSELEDSGMNVGISPQEFQLHENQ